MRDIKFRFWDSDFSQMNYEDDYNQENLGLMLTDKERYVIMQYTGLKDKNGVEIYEGDILKGHYFEYGKEYRIIGEIKYRWHGFELVGVKQYTGLVKGFNPLFEIIGNIHENHVLLEGDTHA